MNTASKGGWKARGRAEALTKPPGYCKTQKLNKNTKKGGGGESKHSKAKQNFRNAPGFLHTSSCKSDRQDTGSQDIHVLAEECWYSRKNRGQRTVPQLSGTRFYISRYKMFGVRDERCFPAAV